MDVKVKSLIDYVSDCKDEKECKQKLQKAFDLITQMDRLQFTTDMPQAISTDMLIQLADLAIKNNLYDIGEECINLFFMRSNATDLHRCEAYLYLAQLSAPTNIFDVARLEKASQHIIRALNLATKNPNLHPEIYKASLLYWKLSHPFLRPGFYHLVASGFQNIVRALTEVNSINYNWRALLSITLIEIYSKTGRKIEAMEIAKTANIFIKKFAPTFYKRLLELLIRYQLADSIVNMWVIKSSVELFAFYSIVKLNYNSDVRDITRDITKIMFLLNINIHGTDNIGQSQESVASSQSPRESKKKSSSKDSAGYKVRLTDSPARQYLLLELTRLCLKNNLLPLAQTCVTTAMNSLKHKEAYYTQLKFAESEIMVKSLGDNEESYSRKSVETRLNAIKLCEENIAIAWKQNDASAVQCGCVTLWNLSLPLLQSNLRHHLCKPLTLVAQALEDIQSLFIQLRCQVHRELALCEEKEHIQIAISHLKKAIVLDGSKVYHNQLSWKLNYLTLVSELYMKPDSPEDIAGKIIEEARKVKPLGTKEGMRALLIKAGTTLSPDAFLTVIDSESLFCENVKILPNMTYQLADRVQKYNAHIKKIDGHLLTVEDKQDQIRMHLWADLSKVARKHGVWDVCRTAAMFCLLYDDNRWSTTCKDKDTFITSTECNSFDNTFKSDENVEEISVSKKKKVVSEKLPLSDLEHVRLLAEINFIQGEACLKLLYQENVKLNDLPVYPQDYSKHGKHYETTNPAEDKDWQIYCQWIQQMNNKITSSFLRGLIYGCNLNESYIVGNAATYLWNYNLHIIEQNRQSEIVGCLTTVLESIQKVDFSEFVILLMNICINLATGLMMPWMPAIPDKTSELQTTYLEKTNTQKNQPKSMPILISTQAAPDLKRAIEICEYAIEITNRKKYIGSIPLSIKVALFKTWVIAKQMSLQQIYRSVPKDDDYEKQTSQIIVDLEMYTYTKNGVMEFKDLLPLSNLVSVMLKHQWKDALIKLQLCTRLAEILYNNKHYDLVVKLAKAVTKSYMDPSLFSCEKEKNWKSIDKNHIQEKVSYLFLLMGQCLTENMEGQAVRWEAINNFIKAAEYSVPSHNYTILMKATRNYWNSIQPLINICSERKSLKASLQEILSYISKVTNKIKELLNVEKIASYVSELNRITLYGYVGKSWESEPIVTNDDDDQKLQISLYNVLCDCFEDSNNYEMIIKTLNTAISNLPQSCHKIQLYRRRIVVKAKLGENMLMDLQKFREKEEFVAILWRDIALHSNNLSEQCIAYQNAIESLSSVEYSWQKIDYLLEFSQWLYTYQMPEQIVVDQIEWAIDILMGIVSEINKETSVNQKIDSKLSSMSYPLPNIEENTQLDQEQAENSNINENDSHADPLEKEIIIGAPLHDCTTATEKMNNVKQLSYLIKCYTLLCEIYTPASPFYIRYSLMAYSFTIRLWQVCTSAALTCFTEIAKTQSVILKDFSPVSKTSEASKQKVKEKTEHCFSPTKEKNKKKFLNVNVSSLTSEEWAVFEVPSDLEEIFTHPSLETRGINENTINDPMMSLHYLDKLVANLQNIGSYHLTLPVLALMHTIASFAAHSKSFVLYTYCKRMEVCAKLNLPQCSSFHENVIDQTSGIDSNEVVEIKEKFHEYILEKNSSEKPDIKKEKTFHKCHLGHSFQDTYVYQIWTKTAEALIEQTHYQLARKFLCEAYEFATSFKDIFYQGKLCFLKAKLAFFEAQYKDAFDLCMKAEEIMVGDLECWYEIIMLKADAALHTFPKNGCRFVEQFLQSMIKEFENLSLTRPNQTIGCGFTIALIQAKIGEVRIEYFISQYNNLSSDCVQKEFRSSFKYFDDSAEFLLKHKFTKDAVKVMHNHAKLLHRIALTTTNDTNTLWSYYLESIKVFTRAIMHARVNFYDVMRILPKDINLSLSLPLHREFSSLQNSCAEVMSEFQTIKTNNEIEKIQRNHHDIERLKLEKEFIFKSPDYLETENKWIMTKHWIANEILSLATSAHSLARTIPWIKSRSLLIIGKCLVNLSFLEQTFPSQVWFQYNVEADKESLDNENIQSDENREGKNVLSTNSNQTLNLLRKISELKLKDEISLCYFCQATECLTQALNIAFNLKQTDVIMQASYELMNAIGHLDAITSSNLLALYQSCQASSYLNKLLDISQADPYSCRLAALLHQRKHLLNNYIERNFICTNIFSAVTNSLETDWQAWKNTLVLSNHFDIVKDFPNNFNFIILQHSPDKCSLFCSLLDKPKLTKSAAVLRQQTPNTPGNLLKRSSIWKCKVNPDNLDQLLKMLKLYKENIRRTLLRKNFEVKNQPAFKDTFESFKSDPDSPNVSESIIFDDEDWMKEKFEEIVALMEDYLAPLLKSLQTVFQNIFAPLFSNISIKDISMKDNSEHSFIIILADPDLLELPLESLNLFREYEHMSVTRDISLQFLYHRFHQEELLIEETKEKKHRDKKSHAKTSRLLAYKDLTKKRKREPTDHVTPPWGLSVDTDSIKYIVDANYEFNESEKYDYCKVFKSLLTKYEHQYTSNWSGLCGDIRNASSGELEIYLNGSGSFIFFAPYKLTSYLNPSKIPTFNLAKCVLVCQFDLSENCLSYKHQSHHDALKSGQVSSLENPVTTALLLSLAGVRCIMSNQWASQLSDNINLLKTSMKYLLSCGLSTGETIRYIHAPYLKSDTKTSTEEYVNKQEKKINKKPPKTEKRKDVSVSVIASNTSVSQKKSSIMIDLKELNPNCFNTVCYGLPNVFVSQI